LGKIGENGVEVKGGREAEVELIREEVFAGAKLVVAFSEVDEGCFGMG
jgi:hypothetical protein